MIGAISTNASNRPGWGFRRNLAGAGLVILAIVGSSAAQEDFSSRSPSGPSSAPATAPATSVFVMPVETSPAMPGTMPPLPAAKTVDEGLDLTYVEDEILNSVRDYDSQDLHKAIFVLLRRAAALPKLDADQLSTLDRPSYRNMLDKPERYRGEPIRMTVHVSAVYEYSLDSRIRPPANRWWPGDRTFWRLDCLNSSGKKAWDEPVVIYTHLDPTGILGKGKVGNNCTFYDPQKNRVELAGIFFKVFEAKERGEKETDAQRRRMYPVVVAWQIEKTGTAASEPSLILLIVVLLVFLYMCFRRLTRRQRQGGRAGYRSLGDLSKIEPQPEVVGEPRVGRDQAADAGEVDPDLKAAAEEYRKEKGLDDDANDRG